MKKILFSVLILPFLCFSCSASDGEEKWITEEAAYIKQTEMYNMVLDNIDGHWKAAQQYTNAWTDVPKGYQSSEYIFNIYGTFKQINYPFVVREGRYSITRNEKYTKFPLRECELFLLIHEDAYPSEKYVIWMENGYLRIAATINGSGRRPSEESGGIASIRFKK